MTAKPTDEELAEAVAASRAAHADQLAAEIVATRLEIQASYARWQAVEAERLAQARRVRGIRPPGTRHQTQGGRTCQTSRARRAS